MTRVSLSEREKSIDGIWQWYLRASRGLRLRLAEERAAGGPVAERIFFGLAPDELDEFFLELDYLTIMDLLSATEAAVRVDFLRRVQDKGKDPLSRSFRKLAKAFGQRVALEEHILDEWVTHHPNLRSPSSDFKGALKLRHWLAHGRYWTPKLARPAYTPADVFDICDRLLVPTQIK
jgi:hypothetical protein